ncbi:tetratricopeptide repeat protein [Vibrio sp. IRLE0018]|uniref:tetratricopeptide repeat protein n=1 Tax=Vibrio floridensis TaxID=2908007 RepID=UPI001F16B203|nr:tetratricopeptide repeat protein [Vibrio floridensis]MCF8779519.1 tetratricopeptide repeat protein [Vibrio floridensis]
MRWQRFFAVLFLLVCWQVSASPLSSVLLTEAEQLIEIEPEQAKRIVQNYLTQRELTDNQEKSPSAISREDADRTLRTPSGSVEAYKILAQAEFALGNQRSALMQLETASQLSQTFHLPYLEMEIKLMQTKLQWQYSKDYAKAEAELAQISEQLKQSSNSLHMSDSVQYRLLMQQALLASQQNQLTEAEQYYAQAKELIKNTRSENTIIDYHIAVGEFYLNHQKYNLALSELLFGYWQAVEGNKSARLAKVNRLLAQLFEERRVLDKALEYLSQAADFYDSYPNSPILAQVMEQMGDIYFRQGKYNLALVHYFNVLDHDSSARNIKQVIGIRLNLAATYLQLYNYPLAEQYLERAQDVLEFADIPKLKAEAALMKAGLAFYQNDSQAVIDNANKALEIVTGLAEEHLNIKQHAYQLLSLGYEQSAQYALSLQNLRRYNNLVSIEQKELNQISEDAFRQQKEFAEQTIHYIGQAQQLEKITLEHSKFQKIAFALFVLSLALFLLLMRRGVLLQRQSAQLERLTSDLYTHSRSKLRNLRMLNVKLSNSLRKANETFEQWQLGELINEPLNDRLRFVMLDLPFLRSMYVQHGYKAGLELERAFGAFMSEKVQKPARLYHFSDANLLYIEPNADRNYSAEEVFSKMQAWVDEFAAEHAINRTVRMGMADYPFLPRAYTAINDQELLDLLLLATHLAREVSLTDKCSHYVYLKAIDNAPAASLATGNIRVACQQAIHQGLIKIHSSHHNEDNLKKLLKSE